MDVVERLGFGTGTTVAVVHADDIGMRPLHDLMRS
jgi:hypothetical protein